MAGVSRSGLEIGIDNPSRDDVRLLLERHLAHAFAHSPPDHVHALDLEGLLDPSVTFVTARAAGSLLAVGALRELSSDHGELKSMHTAAEARRQGVARALVDHLLALARARGYRRLSLETGTAEAFAPARSLYLGVGFTPCEPFGDYTANPYSLCMTMQLR